MSSATTPIGPLLQGFFVEHLLQHKHVSPQTIASYRDTFRLLLQYVHKTFGTEPAALKVTALDAPVILAFLDSLEQDRRNSIRSRNIRLHPRGMTVQSDSISELELLDRVLSSTALASEVYFAGEPCGEWRLNTSGSGQAAFHLVLRGAPWVHLPGRADSRQLRAGDFVFFPRDASHVVTNSPDAPEETDTVIEAVRPVGSSEEATALICGKLKLEPYAERFLLAPLPNVVVMPRSGVNAAQIVPGIVSIMWDEVRGHARPLSVTLNKLADVLVVQVLRFAIGNGLASSGVFAGLADSHLRRAILDLIRKPEHAWSVDLLAQRALLSRSTFAARFQAVVGRTPLDFLRDWRMRLAVDLLRNGRSVADVALATGYDTEASFAKAFKRVIGVGPGAMRVR